MGGERVMATFGTSYDMDALSVCRPRMEHRHIRTGGFAWYSSGGGVCSYETEPLEASSGFRSGGAEHCSWGADSVSAVLLGGPHSQ